MNSPYFASFLSLVQMPLGWAVMAASLFFSGGLRAQFPFQKLVDFQSGVTPAVGLVQGADGAFYGLTKSGGVFSSGMVFKLTAAGVFTRLASFDASATGSEPLGSLVLGSDGAYYGLTSLGGENGFGTAFKVTTAGVLTKLVDFSEADGTGPSGSLVLGASGVFYGLASLGGENGVGTAFKLTAAGVLTKLADFDNAITGDGPMGSLVKGTDGNFYGLTSRGGANGVGTAFKLTAAGALTKLADFDSATTGGAPLGSLVQGIDGAFYGLSSDGGANGYGAAFKLTVAGVLTKLADFDSGDPQIGGVPYGSLIKGSDDVFYGMASSGGLHGFGVVFQLTAAGVLKKLANFNDGIVGGGPNGNLVQATNGVFYGMTVTGGANSSGTAFRLSITAPTVTSISPSNGTIDGGTAVTITGTGFTEDATVTIGGVEALDIVVESATTINCTAPSGSAGTASVRVITPFGSNPSNTLYTYTGPLSVTAISPVAGLATGGTPVTITGSGFTGASSVTIGGSLARNMSVVNDTRITCTTSAGTAGSASVQVNVGSETNEANDFYTYFNPLTVTSISPNAGTTEGGITVTITGTGFTGAILVTIGGVEASDVVVESDTTLSCTTPSRSAGAASVRVTSPFGSNPANTLYTYITPLSVTAVSPVAGVTTGGTQVAITGTGFTGASSVTIGGSLARNMSVVNDTRINFTTSAGIAGSASVQVNRGAETHGANAFFRYFNPLTVTAVSPSAGSIYGGSSVTITGTGFTGATLVAVGGVAAADLNVVSDTMITCTVPQRMAGPASIQVTTPFVTSASSQFYRYVEPLSVTSVSPNRGTMAGGTSVTITGTGFMSGAMVSVGGNAATNIVVVNDTSITCTTPAGEVGSASVMVTTALESNASDALYTYFAPPTVTSVLPNAGLIQGGDSVTIMGTGFAGTSQVHFGRRVAQSFSVVNDTTITAINPNGPIGAVSVNVTTANGSNVANAFFTYKLPESVTKLAQTITFTPPTILYLSQSPYSLSASSSSGLPVSFRLVTPIAGASLLGSTLSFTSAGTLRVEASVAATDTFKAFSVIKTITVQANPTALTLVDLAQTYDGQPKRIKTVGGGVNPVISYQINKVDGYGSTEPTNVGSYSVKVVDGAVTKLGTLVIAKAPLYVRPDSKTKFAGQDNPTLTFTITGFKAGDTGAVVTTLPVLKTTASKTSSGGIYPITASGAAALNYIFHDQQGSLLVESFAGSYEVLLMNATQPVAKLSITIVPGGTSFTAKMASGATTSEVSFAGTLVTDPVAEIATGNASTNVTINTVKTPHSINFNLPITGGITASATRDSIVFGGPTNGHKLLVLPVGRSVNYAGAHTAVLEPSTMIGNTTYAGPRGAGWATASISTTGVMTLTGRLGDGTVFTTTLPPDEAPNPTYRLFMKPYLPARTESYLAGAFTLIPHPNPATNSSLTNRRYVPEVGLTWKKAGLLADTAYRTSFGPVNTVMMLDPWLPPAAAKAAIGTVTAIPAIPLAERLGLTTSPVTFGVTHSPTLSAAQSNLPTGLGLSSTNVVSVIAPTTVPVNSTKWKTLTFLSTTGAFTGSFELSDVVNNKTVLRPVTFSGVLRQPELMTDLIIGAGHYVLQPVGSTVKTTGEIMFTRP